MSTIGINLPPTLQGYFEEEMARRGYKDASEFVAALLEAERFRDLGRELEESLEEALNGPSTPLTNADFDGVIREGTEILNRRRKP